MKNGLQVRTDEEKGDRKSTKNVTTKRQKKQIKKDKTTRINKWRSKADINNTKGQKSSQKILEKKMTNRQDKGQKATKKTR